MKKSQNGFSIVELLIIILLLILLGAGGYYVWQKNKNDKKPSNNAQPAEQVSEVEEEKSVYDGWKEYCSPEEKACFKYPNDWTYSVTDQDTATSTFKSPGGSEVKWVAAIGGLGGGCDADTEPHIFINKVTPVTNEADFYVVEYGKDAVTNTSIALMFSANAISTGDTGDCIYFPYFSAKNSTYAGAKASAGLFASYDKVVDAEEATVKNILLSYKYQ